MAYRQLIAAAILAGALPFSSYAETVALNPDHPSRYVVQKGDTLWDISGRFLTQPWLWPSIWQANPQIRNPDLIFPGDELALSYEGGKPVIRVSRRGGRPVIKLSPRVRPQRIDRAIPTIPLEVINHFLVRPRVVMPGELEILPYLVSVGEERLAVGSGATAYVRGLEPGSADRFVLLRQGEPYLDSDNDGELVGYEATFIGEASLIREGDPATIILDKVVREVMPGDRLVPITSGSQRDQFVPRAPEKPVEARIIAVVDGVTQIGQYQTVVLNVGKKDGMDAGHVLAVYQDGAEIVDEFAVSPKLRVPEPPAYIELEVEKQDGVDGFTRAADRVVRKIQDMLTPEDQSFRNVKLPDERAGVVMVVRPFERISYALVMEAERTMHIDDVARNP